MRFSDLYLFVMHAVEFLKKIGISGEIKTEFVNSLAFNQGPALLWTKGESFRNRFPIVR